MFLFATPCTDARILQQETYLETNKLNVSHNDGHNQEKIQSAGYEIQQYSEIMGFWKFGEKILWNILQKMNENYTFPLHELRPVVANNGNLSYGSFASSTPVITFIRQFVAKSISVTSNENRIENIQGYWTLLKPSIQHILSYLEDKYSISEIHQTIPFMLVENFLHFGDQLYLLHFLKKKLDKDFSKFIVEIISKYTRPIDDIAKVFRRIRQGEIENIMNDLGFHFLAFLKKTENEIAGNKHSFPYSAEHNHRQSRQVFNRYKKNTIRRDDHGYGHDDGGYDHDDDGYGHDDDGYGHGDDGYGHDDDGYGHDDDGYRHDDDGHDSGYSSSSTHGGGGYGGGYGSATLDPYVVLGSLALGSLLGYVLNLIINGTAAIGRDIPDSSFLLWLSDAPNYDSEPRVNDIGGRSTRDVYGNLINENNPKEREDWFNGLSRVEHNILDTHYPSNKLNNLWRTYKSSDDPLSVRRELCQYLLQDATVEVLAGTSSVAALMM